MKPVIYTDKNIVYFNQQSKKTQLLQELLEFSYETVYLTARNSASQNREQHSHWFAEVFFISAGTGLFILNGLEYPVERGDIVFINPNIPHTELNHEGLCYYCLGISNIHFEVDATSSVGKAQEYYDEYVSLFERMLQEFGSDNEYNVDFINNYFERFCLLIKRHFHYSLSLNHSNYENLDQSSVSKNSAAVEIARGYMENNLHFDIDLDMLAKMTFVSKQHLIRLFTEIIGYTPMQYLNRLRISSSMYNLMLREDSISQVAQQMGFKSSYAYIKMFKKTTGYTPQQFRIAYANDIKEAERILAEVSKIKKKDDQ